MKKQTLHFSCTIIIVIVLCFGCNTKVVYFNYDTGSSDTIIKKVITHQILNPELKQLLTEYNAIYKDHPEVEGLGLCIYCRIYTDSIYYSIGYSFGINNISGLIICEPIEGKDVSLIMMDLYHDFSLPSERSIEILKNSNPEEYMTHKENQKATRWVKGGFEELFTMVISDFPGWNVVFDRNHHLLRVVKSEDF